MARPLNDGLPYIGLPTDWFRLAEHKILRARLGEKALLIWTDLYLSCFERNGYYKSFTEDDVSLLADEYRTNEDFIWEVMDFLAARSLIDGTLLRSEKVLTSREIQLVYQEAAKKRGKSRGLEVRQAYWLLEREKTYPYVKVCSDGEPSRANLSLAEPDDGFGYQNDSFGYQNDDFGYPKPHKEKERKEKERKENKTKGKKTKEKRSLAPPSPRKRTVRLRGTLPDRSVSQRCENLKREYDRLLGDILPRQDGVTDKQRQLFRQGWELGFRPKDYRAVFRAVRESAFLRGENGSWRATFEWLITPEKMKKVLSGAYRDYALPKGEPPPPKDSSFDTDEFFEAAVRRTRALMMQYSGEQIDGSPLP